MRMELAGTIVPLVTPFAGDESFDARAMVRLVDFVLEQGADGLMPTALTGEGPLLDSDETVAVWDAVFDRAGGRLPIVPAVISTTTRRAIALTRAAEERGATHDDVYAFYADVAASTSLPIVLFNYPSLTGVDFVPQLAARLAGIDNVQYIKESTGDTRRIHGVQRLVGERLSVICGAPNVALESLALGCRVWITGIMNVVPRSAQQLMRAAGELGDYHLARRIYYEQILPVVDVLARNQNPTGTIKAGVCARGVDVGVPRRPGGATSRADQELLEGLIAEIARAEARTAGEMGTR
jgi:4-hydroxy-tetrahydrodipicolinate synthase